jgi:hypothetical protein
MTRGHVLVRSPIRLVPIWWYMLDLTRKQFSSLTPWCHKWLSVELKKWKGTGGKNGMLAKKGSEKPRYHPLLCFNYAFGATKWVSSWRNEQHTLCVLCCVLKGTVSLTFLNVFYTGPRSTALSLLGENAKSVKQKLANLGQNLNQRILWWRLKKQNTKITFFPTSHKKHSAFSGQ